MRTTCRRFRCYAVAFILAAGFVAINGCGETIEEEEPISMVEEEAASMFPIMLHNKTVRHGGYSIRLQFSEITDVELHENSEKAPDGTRTALVSFRTDRAGQAYKVKVSVKYRQLTTTNDAGEEVLSYPLRDLKAVSIDRVTN